MVFIGPYEHHSNELPWRESIAERRGHRRGRRRPHRPGAPRARAAALRAARPLRIGSFSAASNVTGIVSDTGAIAGLLHRHGALSFWDYAAAGPYVDDPDARRRGPTAAGDHKDAVFLSPHKFIGGPRTPGVLLVARASLSATRVPTVPGGGTVALRRTRSSTATSTTSSAREEGGTPAIIESIRAGLVFQLKQAVGDRPDPRSARSRSCDRAIAPLGAACPSIEILGTTRAERLSIVSFRPSRRGGRYLHHNFVVALLNDLFGIQARGGCSCAGPYGHRLLASTWSARTRLRGRSRTAARGSSPAGCG